MLLKIISKPSVTMNIAEGFGASLRPLWSPFCETVRSVLTKVFPFPLPTLLTLFYLNPGGGIKHVLVRRLAGSTFSEQSGDPCLKAAA